MTAKAPTGTAKVRIQSSIGCNYVKMDAFCLRPTLVAKSANTASSNIQVTKVDAVLPGLNIAASPNPANSYFNLAITSDNNTTPVNVRIVSTDGRLLSLHKTGANSTIKVQTEKWRSGVYFVEVIQGERRKVVKVVKL